MREQPQHGFYRKGEKGGKCADRGKGKKGERGEKGDIVELSENITTMYDIVIRDGERCVGGKGSGEFIISVVDDSINKNRKKEGTMKVRQVEKEIKIERNERERRQKRKKIDKRHLGDNQWPHVQRMTDAS